MRPTSDAQAVTTAMKSTSDTLTKPRAAPRGFHFSKPVCYTPPNFMGPTLLKLFSALVIIGQVLLVIGALAWLTRRGIGARVWSLMNRLALPGAFAVAAVSMVGSLLFSEVAKFSPCVLCWYQRILMYPQVLLLGLALNKKNRDVVPSAMILSVIGFFVAGYHYALQLGAPALGPCTAAPVAVDCAAKVTPTFGYVTIPLMAATGFAMIIVAMLIHRRRSTTPNV